MNLYGPLVSGQQVLKSGSEMDLCSPIDWEPFARVNYGTDSLMRRTLEGLDGSFQQIKELSSGRKSKILNNVANLLTLHKERLARLITKESAKPISSARAEIDRAIFTFETASEETKRIVGEIIPLDVLNGFEKRKAYYQYTAKGVVAGITPFNFPINLVAHKVAPAMAAGCPVIIKPAPQTPISAIELGLLIIEAGWPKEAISIFPCENSVAEEMICDYRVNFFSFTGSDTVGWLLKQKTYKKDSTLELGGAAPNIIHRDANLAKAIGRLIWGAFINSGQTCVSVQKVYVHQSVYKTVKSELIKQVDQLAVGSPWDEKIIVGPMISIEAAKKVENLVNDALERGATCLLGGKREANLYQPTLVESNDETLAIHQEEVFGPVLVLSSYVDVEELVVRINQSKYGLQAGLFSYDLRIINYVSEHLITGGLNINDVSTFRADHLPYGGIKDSGCGREGVYYAIREMMDRKLITTNE